jgi:hypothetical protein
LQKANLAKINQEALIFIVMDKINSNSPNKVRKRQAAVRKHHLGYKRLEIMAKIINLIAKSQK